jgi:hypothetical protein
MSVQTLSALALTHEKHGIRYLVLADSSTQNDHTGLLCVNTYIVQSSDVAHDVDDESRVLVRVKVKHVP